MFINSGQRVHVPPERGVVMPEIDSMTEDLPADWSPERKDSVSE
jgi:hypothetical protein